MKLDYITLYYPSYYRFHTLIHDFISTNNDVSSLQDNIFLLSFFWHQLPINSQRFQLYLNFRTIWEKPLPFFCNRIYANPIMHLDTTLEIYAHLADSLNLTVLKHFLFNLHQFMGMLILALSTLQTTNEYFNIIY